MGVRRRKSGRPVEGARARRRPGANAGRRAKPPRGVARLRDRAPVEPTDTFYRSLVETLPQSFFRKDLDGRLTFANSKYCQTVGYRLEDLLGKLDVDYFPSEIAAKY